VIVALTLRHLRHLRGLIGALIVGVVAFQAFIIPVAASFEANTGLDQILAMLPPAFRALLDAQIGMISFGAFVAFGFQHPAIIVCNIAFAVVAGTIVAGERDAGTLDLLLARPVARRQYLATTVLCLTVGAIGLPLCQLATIAIALQFVQSPDELPWTAYTVCAVQLTALTLAIGGFALLMATLAPRRGAAVVRVVAVVVVLYVVEFLAELWPPLRRVRWLSVFHYFKPVPSVVGDGLPPAHLVVLLGVFVATTCAAFVRLEQRDV
jgi:ABC-type transport system involved in multi-copper enzyme maturation permease subunit